MCGLFGLLKVNKSKISKEDYLYAQRATNLMRHRGPDDEGYWSDDTIVLAFRRLSILDLSPAGHQPMVSPCGRFVLVYNGELYNYRELKKDLIALGYRFRSRTDTEVVLNSLIEWGPNAFVRFNGMYALAFYDTTNHELLIARDHVGMKPLYYGQVDNSFVFGSQLDHVAGCFDSSKLHIDQEGLAFFLTIGTYPAPYSVYSEIRQLEAGKWLKIDRSGNIVAGEHFNLSRYYLENAGKKITDDELEEVLFQAVSNHLISDVPVGTFLSGGIDSGLVTYFAAKASDKPFDTFTLANPGHAQFDESERAANVAKELHLPNHRVEVVDWEHCIEQFARAYSEPFSDYSAVATLLVTEKAKERVKVLLSGDGSDEFFFGYNRMTGMLQGGAFYPLPFVIRRVVKKLFPSIPKLTFSSFAEMIFAAHRISNDELLDRMGFTINQKDLAQKFLHPFDRESLPYDVLIKLNTAYRYFQMQLLKVDRASMYHSVEVRVPFADKNVLRRSIAYRAREATENKYRKRKTPVARIYNKKFRSLQAVQENKKGFSLPMADLLNGKLLPYFLDTLNTTSEFDSHVNFDVIRKLAEESPSQVPPMFAWAVMSLKLFSNRMKVGSVCV